MFATSLIINTVNLARIFFPRDGNKFKGRLPKCLKGEIVIILPCLNYYALNEVGLRVALGTF